MLIFLILSNQTVFASFSDVEADFHQYTSINWLQEQGVVEGYADGSFQPDKLVNRAEFLKMLYETIGMEGHNPTLPFPDVPEYEWYTKYVKEAYETGVVQGYPDGTFKPESTINLAEALKIIREAFFVEVDADYGEGMAEFDYCPNGFLDFDELMEPDKLAKIDNNAWYWKYVVLTGELCVFDFGLNAYGMGGLWMDSPVDRGDMAEMLYRAAAVVNNMNSQAMFYYPFEQSFSPADIN